MNEFKKGLQTKYSKMRLVKLETCAFILDTRKYFACATERIFSGDALQTWLYSLLKSQKTEK